MSRSAGRIGWVLVWAVVFCDIGTSVYYVPGILYNSTGDHAGFFVLATLAAFVLLSIKYVEVVRRFPSGGGVVSSAGQAIGPWAGCLGGQFIMVDYFLTVAISATSGVFYLDSVWDLGSNVLPTTLGCLVVLMGLNIVGIKESAIVSLGLATVAAVVNVVVIGASLLHAPPEVLARIPEEFGRLRDLTPAQALIGYGGAWLAFSGLESISQLAPAMRDLGKTPRWGMAAVVISVLVTAPMLTFLSTFSLPEHIKATESERFISELGFLYGGPAMKIAVVLSASALLLFAANTAIIGNYHVQIALQRKGFLPDAIGALSHRYQTPYRAIILSVLVPAVVLLIVGDDMNLLGQLYAFGLLGAFALQSVSLDMLRWREGQRGAGFWLGIFTSLSVLLAFGVNLFAKPLSTAFGTALAGTGMFVAWLNHSGRLERLVERIPRLAPPAVVEGGDLQFYTVEQAAALGREGGHGIMVASRGATRKIFQEAVDRARTRGLPKVYLLYVDEIPGLFYPQLASPTPEGLTVLEVGAALIRELGMEAVPVWALSHSAAAAVAEAAVSLGCDTVVIGATQRNFLWAALRGKFIQEALRQMPSDIRLIVVG